MGSNFKNDGETRKKNVRILAIMFLYVAWRGIRKGTKNGDSKLYFLNTNAGKAFCRKRETVTSGSETSTW